MQNGRSVLCDFAYYWPITTSNKAGDMKRFIAIGVILFTLTACPESGLRPGEGYVEVEGGKVWYQIVGSGTKTPLLLLHGGPGAPSHYLKPLERVAADRPVIFYDQLGAGRSDRPSDRSLWSVDRFVEELAQVRTALGLGNVHILGHSWGSMLAMDYMLTEPEGVTSITFASPALNVKRWTDDAKTLLEALPEELQATIELHEGNGTTHSSEYQDAVMEYYKLYLSRSDPWSPDLMAAFDGFNTDLYEYMWGPSEFTATGVLSNYDRENELSRLDLPVLFTAGRYDEATPKTVRHFHSLVPDSEIMIFENSAHMTMLDEPELYSDAIRDFLNRVDSSR
jgi:proline iminopeptidase